MPVGRHSLPPQPLTTEMTKALDRLERAQKELTFAQVKLQEELTLAQQRIEKELTRAQEEFQKDNTEAEETRDWIITLAVQSGMSANRPTLPNAKSTLEKTLQQHLALKTDLESWAQTLGYDSFARARMGMGARTNRHDLVVEQLPPVYQKMPIRLALNKSNLELGRIERTIRRTQRELLDAFDAGMSDDIQEEMAEAWADLETLADLEGFYTELIKFNNNYEEPAASETVPTSEMLTRFELASKFSEAFLSDLTEMVQSAPVEVERKESIYRNNANPNNLVEFVLWQHLARDMEELLFLRHMSEFATYLEDRGLAVPHGKTLESGLTASAEHRYDWEWAECVCLNDLLNYFADNGIELNLPQTTVVETEALEETEEELLSCL